TLDGHAVGHGIGERHADFHDVGFVADLHQVLAKLLAQREPGGDEGDDGRTIARAADGLTDSVAWRHGCLSANSLSTRTVRCNVGMSLSPRPESPMRTFLPGFCFAQRLAPAKACADSMAGRMPSSRQHSVSAASESASVAAS